LQGVEQLAGAPKREIIIGQRVHDFVKPHLHLGKAFRERGTGSEGIVATENSFDVPLALVIAVVEEAEFLPAKGRRTAKRAIGLAMVAGGKGHREPRKK
jgi:hypothetical protein